MGSDLNAANRLVKSLLTVITLENQSTLSRNPCRQKTSKKLIMKHHILILISSLGSHIH